MIREWQGRTYEVVVLDDGLSWQGTQYRSLSAIARKITGTAWSGPLFFGLKQNRSAGRRPSQAPLPIRGMMEGNDVAGCPEPEALRRLHPQILRGRARTGVQLAPGAERSLRGLYPQPASRG